MKCCALCFGPLDLGSSWIENSQYNMRLFGKFASQARERFDRLFNIDIDASLRVMRRVCMVCIFEVEMYHGDEVDVVGWDLLNLELRIAVMACFKLRGEDLIINYKFRSRRSWLRDRRKGLERDGCICDQRIMEMLALVAKEERKTFEEHLRGWRTVYTNNGRVKFTIEKRRAENGH